MNDLGFFNNNFKLIDEDASEFENYKFNEFGSLNFKYIICLIFFHLLFYVMKVLKLAL